MRIGHRKEIPVPEIPEEFLEKLTPVLLAGRIKTGCLLEREFNSSPCQGVAMGNLPRNMLFRNCPCSPCS